MATLEIPVGAGEMRHRVILQTKTATKDAYNQDVTSWVDGNSYPAKVEQFRSRMVTNAQQQKAERTGILTLRYFGPIDQTTQRFTLNGRILNIVGVENVRENNRYYRITYQELIGAAAE